MQAEIIRLPTGYEPEQEAERPEPKSRIAERFGVSTKTVDRWVRRDGMPEERPGRFGCWCRVGAHRRFYPSRVRAWLEQLSSKR